MNRLKTYDSSGVATSGILYSGDLNALQDAVAALTDFTQNISLATLLIGDSSIQLLKYGTAEARLSAALRTDGVLRGLGGLYAGAFTTTARNAISSPPYGLVILNTTTNRLEYNAASAGAPNWQPLHSPAGLPPSEIIGYPNDITRMLRGDGTWGSATRSGRVTALAFPGGSPTTNIVTVTHGMSTTPSAVVATIDLSGTANTGGALNLIPLVSTLGATTFQVSVRTADNTNPPNTGVVAVYWIAAP